MTLKFLDDYINNKMYENEQCVVLTYFELRVKFDLSEEDTALAISLARQKLENNGYKTYLTGESYTINNKVCVVQDNELLVAIK